MTIRKKTSAVEKHNDDARHEHLVAKQEVRLTNGVRIMIELHQHGDGEGYSLAHFPIWASGKKGKVTVSCTCGSTSASFADPTPTPTTSTVTTECPSAKFVCDCTGPTPKITCL